MESIEKVLKLAERYPTTVGLILIATGIGLIVDINKNKEEE